MDLDIVALSRLQFATTALYHFLFVPLTLGLSGGQSRRLALARLLLKKNTPLWLLDEPTEGLDTRTARDVLCRLAHEAQQRQRTLVIATHLRREAALADRLLRIQGGCLVADLRRGTPAFESALDALRQD